MALTTDARTEIAAALLAAGLPAFPYIPETVSLPAVMVVPGDPYITLDRIGPTLEYLARFRVFVVVQALDTAAALAANEALLDATITALPVGVSANRVSPPLLDDMGAQGAAMVSEIEVTAHVSERN